MLSFQVIKIPYLPFSIHYLQVQGLLQLNQEYMAFRYQAIQTG